MRTRLWNVKTNKILKLASGAAIAFFLLGLFFLLGKQSASTGISGENGTLSPVRKHGPTGDATGNSYNALSREQKIRLERDKQAMAPAVFGETGMLTTGASESLGLSREQFYKVNDLMFKNNKAFEEAIRKGSRLNPNESNPEKNITVYDIPALEDRGETLLSEFKNGLISELGVAQGMKLYQMFEASQGADRMFGGYGKYDVKLRFEPADPSGVGEIAARFTYSDPVTGQMLSKSEMLIEEFIKLFGNTFEFDQAPPSDDGGK